jgi:hypothetical protein
MSLGLSGCFFSEGPWPTEGTGGFAEYLPITDNQLQALNDRLEATRLRGAETYDAAAYNEASTQLVRCRRELAAGLVLDANSDIAELERNIDAIEKATERRPVKPQHDLS